MIRLKRNILFAELEKYGFIVINTEPFAAVRDTDLPYAVYVGQDGIFTYNDLKLEGEDVSPAILDLILADLTEEV